MKLKRECEYPERYEQLTRETEYSIAGRRHERNARALAVASGVAFGAILVGMVITAIMAVVP